jgi:D-sedoheptulose 7-phosphate isomerase
MSYAKEYLQEARKIIDQIDPAAVEKMVGGLLDLRRRGGRLFFLGVGGGSAAAAHAVNDFRKLAGFEAYAPTDNSAELTARINDDGWETVFADWLKGSRLRPDDGVFVFSVGGGDSEKRISPNIVAALKYAKEVGATVFGIVGRDGGYTAKVANACLVVPVVNPQRVTPHTEAFQGVIAHLLVSHPSLQVNKMKWEGEEKTVSGKRSAVSK